MAEEAAAAGPDQRRPPASRASAGGRPRPCCGAPSRSATGPPRRRRTQTPRGRKTGTVPGRDRRRGRGPDRPGADSASAAAWPFSRSRPAWPTGSGGAPAPGPPRSGPRRMGMNLQSSTLLSEDTGDPIRPASGRADPAVPRRPGPSRAGAASRASRCPAAFCPSPRTSTARTSASRVTTTRSGCWTGVRSRFGRTFAGEPDRIAAELAADEAVRAADTVLFTVPNQLGRGLQRAHPGHDRRAHRARHRLDAHRGWRPPRPERVLGTPPRQGRAGPGRPMAAAMISCACFWITGSWSRAAGTIQVPLVGRFRDHGSPPGQSCHAGAHC